MSGRVLVTGGSRGIGRMIAEAYAARGAKAVAWAADFLDGALPLARGSHKDAQAYAIKDGAVSVTLSDGETGLADPAAYRGEASDGAQHSYLCAHNGLHIELVFDPTHPVGAASPSGLRDVVLESALTAIQDCEDSIAAVDAEDKVAVYRNWLGLMKGDWQGVDGYLPASAREVADVTGAGDTVTNGC